MIRAKPNKAKFRRLQDFVTGFPAPAHLLNLEQSLKLIVPTRGLAKVHFFSGVGDADDVDARNGTSLQFGRVCNHALFHHTGRC